MPLKCIQVLSVSSLLGKSLVVTLKHWLNRLSQAETALVF